MGTNGGDVIAFPLKRKKKPEIRYRVLPPGSVEQQLRDIEATIKGLLEMRRALRVAYKRSLRIAADTFCMGFIWCHQWHGIVHFLWLTICHKR